MRLFTSFFFLFSQEDEAYISAVDATLQKQRQVDIKQTIPFSDSGATTIAPAIVFTVPWTGSTPTRQRLLDISVNGSTYVSITQNAVVQAIPLKGSFKLPARLTLSLDVDVTAVYIESRELLNEIEISWSNAEYSDDITNIANFPVV